jgi:mRNA interferase RelE/StbE
MQYRLKLPSEIRSRLKLLPERARDAIGYGIFLLQEDLFGDVKKLKGFKDRYRLRVGHYRVLFQLDKGTIIVYDFGDRKDIYR